MRVLHVTTFLQGGAGRIITALAIAQQRAGHDVRLIADAGGEASYGSYPEYSAALAAAGIDVLLLRSTFKRDVALNRAAAKDVERLARVWPPDIVHVHAATPSRVVCLARICGLPGAAPLIHTMHGWGTAKNARQTAEDLQALEHADVVTTPSCAARNHLSKLGLRRADVQVIPYGLPAAQHDHLPEATDVRLIAPQGPAGANPRVAVCIGTLGARKNQTLLVDALATDFLRDTVAVFIGDGDDENIRRRAFVRGVSRRTVILGPRSYASRYLQLADVLVLPSQNEGLPLVVLEALRAGVPVAASDIPEIAEALGPDLRKFLCIEGDANALAAAIRAALDESDRVGLRARLQAHFACHYRESRMLAAYDELYLSACGVAH